MFNRGSADRQVCVLGFGKTGRAAANLLASKGYKVLVSDARAPEEPLGHSNIEFETGHSDRVLDCKFIVKSPGISHSNPILESAKKKSIPVVSEVQLALSYVPASCKVFAITGTNGKTTTTMLMAEILKQHCKDSSNGKKVFTAGNIGYPLSDFVKDIKPGDYIVLEVSSYQLEDSTYFKPYAAAVLNITPDHVDHHGTMQKYVEAKEKIFAFQDEKDIAVLNASDEYCQKMQDKIKSKLYCFATSPGHNMRAHVFYDGDEIIFSSGARLTAPPLIGIHNVENAMAAGLMAFAAGVSEESLQTAFKNFKGVEHRIEYFMTHNGVKYINDSKATNVESTLIALKSMPQEKKIWLILGGKDKGFSYAPLGAPVQKSCKAVLTIGEAAPLIKRDLQEYCSIVDCQNIEAAVRLIMSRAVEGDICLLSPACASFDQFKNFEERGEYFKNICRAVSKGE